jgi:AcrR family transcriptional regulator
LTYLTGHDNMSVQALNIGVEHMSQTEASPTAKGQAAHDRILKAAVTRFASHSYEATGLRDIAADAGVDVAYVHRRFGSKEKLFHASLRAVSQAAEILGVEDQNLALSLVRSIVPQRAPEHILPLDLAVRSFSSPDASHALHDFLETDFIAPLSEKCAGQAPWRAALVAALLGGVGISKDIIKSDALTDMDQNDLEDVLIRLVDMILHG